jgi:hypothetical protein
MRSLVAAGDRSGESPYPGQADTGTLTYMRGSTGRISSCKFGEARGRDGLLGGKEVRCAIFGGFLAAKRAMLRTK